jgi:sterol desaturase/sphingolipid hydroxylase (fatty acid hydroxylase superfamily)
MESIIPALIPLSFFVLLAIERFLPGQAFPKVRWWIPKGILFFGIGGVLNATIPVAVGRLIAGHTLFDLTGLGTAGGALVGVLASTLLAYWLHRFYHRVHAVWRWTHQMHHSAERVDMAGFAYGHPLELVVSTSMTPILSTLLGVSPLAAMVAGFIGFWVGLIEHFNIKTPRWMGTIVQRPEMHCIHHERGVHAYNYGLPLWDMLFGTYRNPRTWTAQAGFWDGASKRTFAMLFGRDVAAPPPARTNIRSAEAAVTDLAA